MKPFTTVECFGRRVQMQFHLGHVSESKRRPCDLYYMGQLRINIWHIWGSYGVRVHMGQLSTCTPDLPHLGHMGYLGWPVWDPYESWVKMGEILGAIRSSISVKDIHGNHARWNVHLGHQTCFLVQNFTYYRQYHFQSLVLCMIC